MVRKAEGRKAENAERVPAWGGRGQGRAHGEDGRISQNVSREQLARQVASGSWRGVSRGTAFNKMGRTEGSTGTAERDCCALRLEGQRQDGGKEEEGCVLGLQQSSGKGAWG